MKELSLQDRKDLSLEIMKDVHAFCIEHNIHYSLAGGTLIGAIRHHEFVPWDDDLDIVLPRPDYERFCASYVSDKYKLFAYPLGNSRIPFARVCDMKRTYSNTYTKWADEETGIWIDIIPLDGIGCSKEEFAIKAEEIRKLYNTLFHTRGARMSLKGMPLKRKIKIIGKRILYGKYNIDDLLKQYHDLVVGDWDNDQHAGNLSAPVYVRKEYLDRDIFDEYILVDFCDTQFCAFKEYDRYLRNYFGDYMQLPPVEQRVPGHGEHKMYWVDEQ